MYSDTHLHSYFSGDSETPPPEQIEKAIALGMETMCFTDHDDHDVVSDIDFELKIPEYIAEMRSLREQYSGRIEILTGIELGLKTDIPDHLREVSENDSFDQIIGSVHFIAGLDPYYPEYFLKFSASSYRTYFDTVLECLELHRHFDTLGHLDYIARYGGPYGLTYSYREYADSIDPILKKVIDCGKALECNTGGMSRGLSDPNPSFDVLRRYKELGGELITLGSDAHSPDTLGYEFDKVGDILKSIGFRYYAVFRNRKPCMYPL